MRLPWAPRYEERVDPRTPHVFLPIDDAGLGTGLAGMTGRDGSDLSQVAVTNRYLRASGCGVPGCGKDRSHPLHAAAE